MMTSINRIAFWLVIAIGFGAAAATQSTVQTRGIDVVVKDRAGIPVTLYSRSYALIVGVSNYTNGWPSLRGVRTDVRLVKAALEKQGFQVTVAMDRDRDGIDRAFRQFIELYGNEAGNRLLFYFAGHGHTLKLGYGGEMGYLVGRDAPNPNIDKIGFKARALSMQVIETYARNIEAKHALFMFDSCFSGAIFNATRAIPEIIRKKTGRPVRQFITSGTKDQTVPDESVFRGQFIAALEGAGDLDGDGYMTGAELGQFLETTVTNYTKGSQTPQYGKLRDPLLDKGDFVFQMAPTRQATPPARSMSGDRSAEIVFWQSIEDGEDAESYQAYLEQYPSGTFAVLARLRVKQFEKKQTVAVKQQQAEAEAKRIAAEEEARRLAEAEAQRLAAVVLPGKSRGTFDNVILSGGPYDPICTTTIHG